MTLVSVVVPVHNAENHLKECLTSIQNQTLTDIEIILINDASTDATPQILAEFASEEPRATILQGPGCGSAGAARNLGMARAAGEYLAFFDADDFFLPTMLEELYAKAAADHADVVACKFRIYNDVTREVTQPNWMLRLELLPEELPFAAGMVADRIFSAFNPAAWNKLFRTEFVRSHGLQFQALRRTNDAYFTYMSLALAERITYLDRPLVNYRVANRDSLQGTISDDPLEFVHALRAIRGALQDKELWPQFERAFVNLALTMCLTNLKRQRASSSFIRLFEALRAEVFEDLGVLSCPDDYFFRSDLVPRRDRVLRLTAVEYLFEQSREASQAADHLRREIRERPRDAVARTERPEAADSHSIESTPKPPVALSVVDDRPDVSVIIPVYNTLVFLDECITSVQRQTGCTVEIICIDDGSQDGSGEALEQYAALDSRITVVRQDNRGLSRTRNTGLSMATGRYVCFLDSDDFWQQDVLAELVRQADADDLHVLLFDAASVREPGVSDELWARYETYYERQAYEGVFDGPRLLAAMSRRSEYRASACLYLAQRDHLVGRGLHFFPGIAHEDNLFTFALLMDAERVAHSPVALYGRRVRPDSIVTAGSRASAARGYFVTWIEMIRLLHGRDFGDPEVTSQVATVVQSILTATRRNLSRLPAEEIDRLAAIDGYADAAALHLVVRRSWSDDRARRRLDRQLKTARAAQLAAPPAAEPAAEPVDVAPAGLMRRVKRYAKQVL